MGFWAMILSFLVAVALIYLAITRRKNRIFLYVFSVLGLLFLAFSIYLLNPIQLWDFTLADNVYDYLIKN